MVAQRQPAQERYCPECGSSDGLQPVLPSVSGGEVPPGMLLAPGLLASKSPEGVHSVFKRADRWLCSCGWDGWGRQLTAKPNPTQEAEQCFRQEQRRPRGPGSSNGAGRAKPLPPPEHRPEQDPKPYGKDRVSTTTQLLERRTAELYVYILAHRRRFLQSEAEVRECTVTYLVELALAEWFREAGELNVPRSSGGQRLKLVLVPSYYAYLERQAKRRHCSISALANHSLSYWVGRNCTGVTELW